MSECQHEYKTEKPRHWPKICTHCGDNKLDIEIAMLKAKLAVVVAVCEAFVEAWEKSMQSEKTDVALRMARAAIAYAKGEDDE